MKFSVLTTDLRLLAYFVTFMKRTKNAKLSESPVALGPFGMSRQWVGQCFAFMEGNSSNCFSPISPFSCICECSHKLR